MIVSLIIIVNLFSCASIKQYNAPVQDEPNIEQTNAITFKKMIASTTDGRIIEANNVQLDKNTHILIYTEQSHNKTR